MHAVMDKKKYAKLLGKVQPHRIETEEENERYLAIVEDMIDKGAENFSPEEHSLFDLLVTLIEAFEEETYPMPELTPQERLRSLMEERDLRQADLLDVFGSRSRASDAVNGVREISKEQAKKLAERFKVSAELFI